MGNTFRCSGSVTGIKEGSCACRTCSPDFAQTTMALSQTSPAARLPEELVAEIAHLSVLEDISEKTYSVFPIARNRFWSDLSNPFTFSDPRACKPTKSDCAEYGFLDRPLSCSLSKHPRDFSRINEADKPDGFRHTSLVCAHVCRRWRYAVMGYRALWADAGLLNLGHINRSRGRSGGLPAKLINPRPLCPCVLQHLVPVLSSASHISFGAYAFSHSSLRVPVSATVLSELQAAAMESEGIKLEYLDLQLTS